MNGPIGAEVLRGQALVPAGGSRCFETPAAPFSREPDRAEPRAR